MILTALCACFITRLFHCLLQLLGHSWISNVLHKTIEPLPRGGVVLAPSVHPVLHHLDPTITSVCLELLIPAVQHIRLQVQQQSKLLPPGTDPVHQSELTLTSLLLPLEESEATW